MGSEAEAVEEAQAKAEAEAGAEEAAAILERHCKTAADSAPHFLTANGLGVTVWGEGGITHGTLTRQISP